MVYFRCASDGIIGSQTRSAVEKAVKAGKIKEIHEKFSDKRWEYLKTLEDFDENPGWLPRVGDLKDK